MTKLKVVVADADREFCNELKAFFQDDERIELLACASDGEQALEKIERYQPDILITEIPPTAFGVETAQIVLIFIIP